MPRSRWINPRSGLAAAIAVLAVLSFAPPRVAGWVGAFRGPVRTVLSPVAAPFALLLGLVSRDETLATSGPAQEALTQRDGYLREVNQLRAENDDLRRVIADLQHGLDLNPNIPVRQFTAAVIGSSMDLSSSMLSIRAGTREGVEPSASVAVVRGVHLVGRVVGSPLPRTCSVLPFTDRSAGSINGVVMLDATRFGPACRLEPRGDGTLSGRLRSESVLLPTGARSAAIDAASGDANAGVKPGMIVRLADDSWPQSAQMLELGIVESVETPAQDIRIRTIVVRPKYRVERVSEVTLRVPAVRTSSGDKP